MATTIVITSLANAPAHALDLITCSADDLARAFDRARKAVHAAKTASEFTFVSVAARSTR